MNFNDQHSPQSAEVLANSSIVQPQSIEIQHSEGLAAVLDSLGIDWVVGRPPNGIPGTMRVRLDREGDFLLEQVISQLSDLRWRYTPGRTLQLAMNLDLVNDDAEGDDDSH